MHDDFCKLLAHTKPQDDVLKGFREIVIRKWNNEYKDAMEHEKRINTEIAAIQAKKSRVIDLYIDDKLSNEQKTSKLNELDAQIPDYELQRIAALDETVSKEKVLDTPMMFITSVDELWQISQ